MNQINDVANSTPGFGYDFDYAVWTAGTSIDLVNVPFNNDYRDVVKPDFDIDEYINSLRPAGITINQMTYVRPGMPIRIDIPFNRANKYNYLRASNPIQPVYGDDEQKNYYYFILESKYIAPNTTEIIVQLDVWQTYVRDIQFGNCYVERGHIGIANINQMKHYGRDYLTVPEGLEVGSDYRTVNVSSVELMGMNENFDIRNDILVVSTVDLLADPGTVTSPTLVTAGGTWLDMVPTGAAVYVFNSSTQFLAFMDSIKSTPWVSQGIVSITVIPKVTDYDPTFVYNANGPTMLHTFLWPRKHILSPNWRQLIIDALPDRYKILNKFLTFPYSGVELTTWSATPINLKPELWNHPDALIMERVNFMPPDQRVQFFPRGYNSYVDPKDGYGTFGGLNPNLLPDVSDRLIDTGDDYGDYLDMVTQMSNFPTLPVVNNMAISYLASNKNTINYQQSSADWSQQRALASNQAQYDITSGAIGVANQLTNIGIGANTALTGINNAAQMNQAIVGAASSILSGGVMAGLSTPLGAVGAVQGAIQGAAAIGNTAIQNDANNQSLAVQNRQARDTNKAQVGQQTLARDTNKGLADWAARGDYQNAIAAVNAKVQDSHMIQPSMSGQYGGDTTNINNLTAELSMRIKLVDLNAISVVGDFWLRYGYSIHRFIKPPVNLMVMSKFTYWKMMETYIRSASVPESFKQSLRGLLEKGITVWNDPNDIGMIDIADNKALPGVAY